MPIKKAALYMRVSNLDQHPETQLYDLRQIAAQRGYQIVREYADRSVAKGKSPGLNQLISDARLRCFDVIIVGSLSDVARSSVKHCLSVMDQLNQLGIGFVSGRENIDTTGELGREMTALINALSQLQRTLVGEAVKAGMRRSRLEGVRLGRRPLNVNRAEIVKDRASGLSLTDVARKHRVSRGLVCRIVKLAGGQANCLPPSRKRPEQYPTIGVSAVQSVPRYVSAES